jgi:hypothetical protein
LAKRVFLASACAITHFQARRSGCLEHPSVVCLQLYEDFDDGVYVPAPHGRQVCEMSAPYPMFRSCLRLARMRTHREKCGGTPLQKRRCMSLAASSSLHLMHCPRAERWGHGKAYRVAATIVQGWPSTSDYWKYCEVSLVWRIHAITHLTTGGGDLRRQFDSRFVYQHFAPSHDPHPHPDRHVTKSTHHQ